MNEFENFSSVPSTTVADLVGREQVMNIGIRPLWSSQRIAGPAFTVRCPPGDNLMMHAAIHRADPGSVIVVESGDLNYALAGGNVCAIAQRRGVTAVVADGLIRDVAEVRERGFPVFARGVIPFPGRKSVVSPLNAEVVCGGVRVNPGDIVVADEEGIAVVPRARSQEVLAAAHKKLTAEASETLEQWQNAHKARIEAILAERGYDGLGKPSAQILH